MHFLHIASRGGWMMWFGKKKEIVINKKDWCLKCGIYLKGINPFAISVKYKRVDLGEGIFHESLTKTCPNCGYSYSEPTKDHIVKILKE